MSAEVGVLYRQHLRVLLFFIGEVIYTESANVDEMEPMVLHGGSDAELLRRKYGFSLLR